MRLTSAIEPDERIEVAVAGYQGHLRGLLDAVIDGDVDILDVELAEVAAQINARLEAQGAASEPALLGELSVVMSRLLEKKARAALPEEDEGGDPEAEEAAARRALINRLLEYRRYRQVADHLGKRKAERDRRFGRPGGAAVEEGLETVTGVAMTDLLSAFENVMARHDEPEAVHEVAPPLAVTVEERVADIRGELADQGPVPFRRLFAADTTRLDVVVTFLAVLELMSGGSVEARQEEDMGAIIIAPTDPKTAEGEAQ